MPAPLLKVLNPHQLLGPAERFLLLLCLRVAHMVEPSGISHILIRLVGWGGPVALLPKGCDHGLEPLQREVILGPGPPSGVGPGLHNDGDDLEPPSDVVALGLHSDRAGPGAEIPREEADLDQQGEAGHTLDLQPLGADLGLEHLPGEADLDLEHLPDGGHDPEHLLGVGLGLEHQPGEAGLDLEHHLDADLGPVHQYDGGLVVGRQPDEVAGRALEHQPGVAGRALEHQPGVAGRALEHQLDEVLGHALERQPGEGGHGLGHQQDEEGPIVEV